VTLTFSGRRRFVKKSHRPRLSHLRTYRHTASQSPIVHPDLACASE